MSQDGKMKWLNWLATWAERPTWVVLPNGRRHMVGKANMYIVVRDQLPSVVYDHTLTVWFTDEPKKKKDLPYRFSTLNHEVN